MTFTAIEIRAIKDYLGRSRFFRTSSVSQRNLLDFKSNTILQTVGRYLGRHLVDATVPYTRGHVCLSHPPLFDSCGARYRHMETILTQSRRDVLARLTTSANATHASEFLSKHFSS